jgi:6-phosphogluconate dehydrogenase
MPRTRDANPRTACAEPPGAKKMSQADFGVIGLAVMGENLVLNMASKGFTVAAFNRTVQKSPILKPREARVTRFWAQIRSRNLSTALLDRAKSC